MVGMPHCAPQQILLPIGSYGSFSPVLPASRKATKTSAIAAIAAVLLVDGRSAVSAHLRTPAPQQNTRSLYYLVSAHQERGRNREVERVCRLPIY
jgi:hypothetical protein